jgi:hypothetical protein
MLSVISGIKVSMYIDLLRRKRMTHSAEFHGTRMRNPGKSRRVSYATSIWVSVLVKLSCPRNQNWPVRNWSLMIV